MVRKDLSILKKTWSLLLALVMVLGVVSVSANPTGYGAVLSVNEIVFDRTSGTGADVVVRAKIDINGTASIGGTLVAVLESTETDDVIAADFQEGVTAGTEKFTSEVLELDTNGKDLAKLVLKAYFWASTTNVTPLAKPLVCPLMLSDITLETIEVAEAALGTGGTNVATISVVGAPTKGITIALEGTGTNDSLFQIAELSDNTAKLQIKSGTTLENKSYTVKIKATETGYTSNFVTEDITFTPNIKFTDIVKLGTGSKGTAGSGQIYNLTSDKYYMVLVDDETPARKFVNADGTLVNNIEGIGKLTGTAITGLDNSKTYTVIEEEAYDTNSTGAVQAFRHPTSDTTAGGTSTFANGTLVNPLLDSDVLGAISLDLNDAFSHKTTPRDSQLQAAVFSPGTTIAKKVNVVAQDGPGEKNFTEFGGETKFTDTDLCLFYFHDSEPSHGGDVNYGGKFVAYQGVSNGVRTYVLAGHDNTLKILNVDVVVTPTITAAFTDFNKTVRVTVPNAEVDGNIEVYSNSGYSVLGRLATYDADAPKTHRIVVEDITDTTATVDIVLDKGATQDVYVKYLPAKSGAIWSESVQPTDFVKITAELINENRTVQVTLDPAQSNNVEIFVYADSEASTEAMLKQTSDLGKTVYDIGFDGQVTANVWVGLSSGDKTSARIESSGLVTLVPPTIENFVGTPSQSDGDQASLSWTINHAGTNVISDDLLVNLYYKKNADDYVLLSLTENDEGVRIQTLLQGVIEGTTQTGSAVIEGLALNQEYDFKLEVRHKSFEDVKVERTCSLKTIEEETMPKLESNDGVSNTFVRMSETDITLYGRDLTIDDLETIFKVSEGSGISASRVTRVYKDSGTVIDDTTTPYSEYSVKNSVTIVLSDTSNKVNDVVYTISYYNTNSTIIKGFYLDTEGVTIAVDNLLFDYLPYITFEDDEKNKFKANIYTDSYYTDDNGTKYYRTSDVEKPVEVELEPWMEYTVTGLFINPGLELACNHLNEAVESPIAMCGLSFISPGAGGFRSANVNIDLAKAGIEGAHGEAYQIDYIIPLWLDKNIDGDDSLEDILQLNREEGDGPKIDAIIEAGQITVPSLKADSHYLLNLMIGGAMFDGENEEFGFFSNTIDIQTGKFAYVTNYAADAEGMKVKVQIESKTNYSEKDVTLTAGDGVTWLGKVDSNNSFEVVIPTNALDELYEGVLVVIDEETIATIAHIDTRSMYTISTTGELKTITVTDEGEETTIDALEFGICDLNQQPLVLKTTEYFIITIIDLGAGGTSPIETGSCYIGHDGENWVQQADAVGISYCSELGVGNTDDDNSYTLSSFDVVGLKEEHTYVVIADILKNEEISEEITTSFYTNALEVTVTRPEQSPMRTFGITEPSGPVINLLPRASKSAIEFGEIVVDSDTNTADVTVVRADSGKKESVTIMPVGNTKALSRVTFEIGETEKVVSIDMSKVKELRLLASNKAILGENTRFIVR